MKFLLKCILNTTADTASKDHPTDRYTGHQVCQRKVTTFLFWTDAAFSILSFWQVTVPLNKGKSPRILEQTC